MPFIAAGASLVGGLMSADAAGDAAAAQRESTRESNARLEKQAAQVRTDLAGYRNFGTGATNALASRLGISTTPDRAALREQLLPQFTSGAPAAAGGGAEPYNQATEAGGYWVTPQAAQAPQVDEAGLNAAIEQAMAQGAPGPGSGDLLQKFTGADVESEPGYKFGLDQGMNALNSRLAAGGNYFSGAALKGATKYAQDYAGTKYDAAYNRDSADKSRIYSMLMGGVNVGQNSAVQTGATGTAVAGQVGNNITGMGNAEGAARIATGNALSSGINNAVDGYQTSELLKRINGGNTGWGGGESWRTTGSGMPAGYTP